MGELTSPPREDLVRAVMPAVETRSAEDGGMTLFGHFARFNEWTEIDSLWEGRFMERIAPGAFKKTMREQGSRMRVLFQHGQDPSIGDKPIASISNLREDEEGAYYEARLFNGLPPLVLDGLRAGEYGASFRFSVMREQWDERPEPSDGNPNGLPERTIKEARVSEFGPVTFPAYDTATAGVRSLTDEFLMSHFRSDPERLRDMFNRATELRLSVKENSDQCPSDMPHAVMDGGTLVACHKTMATAKAHAMMEGQSNSAEPAGEPREQAAPSEDDAAANDEQHLTDERRETTPRQRPIYGNRRKETPAWLLAPSRSTRRS